VVHFITVKQHSSCSKYLENHIVHLVY